MKTPLVGGFAPKLWSGSGYLQGSRLKPEKFFWRAMKERIDWISSQRNNRISYYAFLAVDQLLYNQLKRRCSDKKLWKIEFLTVRRFYLGFKTLCSMHRAARDTRFEEKIILILSQCRGGQVTCLDNFSDSLQPGETTGMIAASFIFHILHFFL